MRLGIIKLSALGDIIVAMSFLPFLQERGYEIDWFVDSLFEGILQDSPFVQNIHSLSLKQSFKNKDFKTLFQEVQTLKKLKAYDLLIDMQGLIKSAIIGKLIPSRCLRGFGFSSCRESLASLFYSQKIHIPYKENILSRNAKLLSLPSSFEVVNPFGFTKEAAVKISSLLQSPHKKVLLLPEASKLAKMYPISHFIQLCQSLQDEKITFFVLHHSFFDGAKQLCENSQATLLPRLSLDEVKALIANVDAVIGGDTGITHLAWAMRKPSITLYGNTPLKRFELRGAKNISLSGNPHANYDKKDFSIAKINPIEIKKHLLEIL